MTTSVTCAGEVTLSNFVESKKIPTVLNQVTAIKDGKLDSLSAESLSAFHNAVSKRGVVCVLLAAGQGSRFKSEVPKVIHPFLGKPLAQIALDAAQMSDLPVIVIVGHARIDVMKTLQVTSGTNVVFIAQEEQMGTGHAVYLARYALPADYQGDIIVSYADNPGVDGDLLNDLLSRHDKNKEEIGDLYSAVVLTGSRKAAGEGANAYGRMVPVTKEGGAIVDIVEKKTILALEATSEKKKYNDVEWTARELDQIDDFNSGIVAARAAPYLNVLGNILPSQTKKDPPKYEYYATDFVKGLLSKKLITEVYRVPTHSMWKLEGANTVEELKELEDKAQKRARNN